MLSCELFGYLASVLIIEKCILSKIAVSTMLAQNSIALRWSAVKSLL